jgi:pimeloyl-ACP methyl ester carboxylesterase
MPAQLSPRYFPTASAVYRICMPATWNGDLVVYAHGYVSPTRPVEIPEDQVRLPNGKGIDEFATDLGYAFVMSSYRTNGLAMREAQGDLLEAIDIFRTLKGNPVRILLVGVSEGGQIAVKGAEEYPAVYDGALALCGPYGDFNGQTSYFGDFRVIFDYFFPGLMPPTPVDIPPALLGTWETATYSTTVKPVVVDPANAAALDQLLAVTAAPFDVADPATKEQTVERLLWYNVYATNDARAKLGGQPYDNRTRSYAGSTDDPALNRDVARFDADPAALATIDAYYQTTGQIGMPLLLMHTKGDPVVPVAQVDLYRAKAEKAGAAANLETYTFDRYGHCTFTVVELVGAFNRLVDLVNLRESGAIYLPLLAVPATESPDAPEQP